MTFSLVHIFTLHYADLDMWDEAVSVASVLLAAFIRKPRVMSNKFRKYITLQNSSQPMIRGSPK